LFTWAVQHGACRFDDQRRVWVEILQADLARLSTRGRQIIVPDSDHMIPFERPDAIVSAIREVGLATGPSARHRTGNQSE
jgi:hypothetical protein